MDVKGVNRPAGCQGARAQEAFLILADDLTGAADSAVALAGKEGEAMVLLDPALAADSWKGIVALDLDTRCLSAEDACARVAHAAARIPDGAMVFKKIDSTLRGHIGGELAALAGASAKPALCIVAPAHPELGRTIEGGRVHIHGKPVDPAMMWPGDAGGAPREISAQLQAHGFDCLKIGLAMLRERETSTLASHMKQALKHRRPAVICDAQTVDDLRRIAAAALSMDEPRILVGSAGLAQAISLLWQGGIGQPARPHYRSPSPGGILFLVGSYSATAAEQVRELAVHANVEHVVLAGDALQAGALDADAPRIGDMLSHGRDVLLSIAAKGGVQPDVSLAFARGMARIARPLIPSAAAVVCCGGDTSRAVLAELGARRLRVCQSEEAGATLAWPDAAPERPFVLKAGAFGDARILLRLRSQLSAMPARSHSIDA